MGALTLSSFVVITAAVLGMVLLFVIAWRTRLPPLQIPPNLRAEPDWPPYPRVLWMVERASLATLIVGGILSAVLDHPVFIEVGLVQYAVVLVARHVGRSWQIRRSKAAKPTRGKDD